MSPDLAGAIADLDRRLAQTDNFVGALRAVARVAYRHRLPEDASIVALRHAAEKKLQVLAQGASVDQVVKGAVWGLIDIARAAR